MPNAKPWATRDTMEAEGVRGGVNGFRVNLLCATQHAEDRARREPGQRFIVYGRRSDGTTWVRHEHDEPPGGDGVQVFRRVRREEELG